MICVFIKTNPAFQSFFAIVVSEIDNVNNFALITTANMEHDFKCGYFFHTFSVATGFVTSLEFFFFKFVLLCCVVSNQLRKSSVITHFHSDSSAATSSATKKRNRSGTAC